MGTDHYLIFWRLNESSHSSSWFKEILFFLPLLKLFEDQLHLFKSLGQGFDAVVFLLREFCQLDIAFIAVDWFKETFTLMFLYWKSCSLLWTSNIVASRFNEWTIQLVAFNLFVIDDSMASVLKVFTLDLQTFKSVLNELWSICIRVLLTSLRTSGIFPLPISNTALTASRCTWSAWDRSNQNVFAETTE